MDREAFETPQKAMPDQVYVVYFSAKETLKVTAKEIFQNGEFLQLLGEGAEVIAAFPMQQILGIVAEAASEAATPPPTKAGSV